MQVAVAEAEGVTGVAEEGVAAEGAAEILSPK